MKVIVTADDLGSSESINDAILQGLSLGLITRASLLANGAAFNDAVDKVRNTEYCIGLHFNLTEGQGLSQSVKGHSVFYSSNKLSYRKSSLKYLTRSQGLAVQDELSAQIEHLRNNGIEPCYVDSHHHIHTDPGIFSPFCKVLNQERIVQSRPARTDLSKSSFRLIWKKYVNRRFVSKGLKISDELYDLDRFSKVEFDHFGSGTVELMLHPNLLEGKLIDASRPNYSLAPLLRKELAGFELIAIN